MNHNEHISIKQQQLQLTKKRELLLLGTGYLEFHELMPHIDKAINELGSEVPVKLITDPELISSYGITQTPAIISIDYQVESQGIIPSVENIKKWITKP